MRYVYYFFFSLIVLSLNWTSGAFAGEIKKTSLKEELEKPQLTGRLHKQTITEHETFRTQHESFHKVTQIKSRAKTAPIAHNGYTEYRYTNISEYQDCVHVGELAGNIVAGARSLYNATEVSDADVRASKCPLYIGNIVGVSGGNVENYVNIQGRVTSVNQPVAIGNTVVSGNSGTVKNTVIIHGSITSLSNSVSIGSTSIRGRVEGVDNSVTINGNVTAQ